MTKKTLFLHIGTHKTGTSTLQYYLHRNRMALRTDGIVYPFLDNTKKTLRIAHHNFALALTDLDHRPEMLRPIPELVDALWQETAADEQVLLSSERFWRGTVGRRSSKAQYEAAQAKYVARVSKALNAFDVTVLVTLRPQDEYLLSLYRGKCTRRDKVPEVKTFSRPFEARMDYKASLETWAQAFGHDNIRVRIYNPQGVGVARLQRTFDDFGISHRIPPDYDLLERHQSPSGEVTELLRSIGYLPLEGIDIKKTKETMLTVLNTDPAFTHLGELFYKESVTVNFDFSLSETNAQIAEAFLPDTKPLLFGREVSDQLPQYVPRDFNALAEIYNMLFDRVFGDKISWSKLTVGELAAAFAQMQVSEDQGDDLD